jgi:hypothetical protein
VELVNLGAGGVCALTPEPLPIGERGMLRVTSPESGKVYECAVQVSWRSAEEDEHIAGLRFVGAPIEVASS